MRNNISAVGPAFVPTRRAESRLDYGFLQRISLLLGGLLVVISPIARDPLAFGIGAMAPWAILRLIGRPNMPAAVAYFLLWQWLQTFARVVQTLVDGETLAGGLYGPMVEQAYWYTLTSVMVLALAFRLVLGGVRAPQPQFADAHDGWQLRDLCALYGGVLVLSSACSIASTHFESLAQPLEALAHIKVLALFMLFSTILSTGKGVNVLLAVMLGEVFLGFSGLFSDFKAVFIYVAVAALATRVKWTGTKAVASLLLAMCLVGLALFWTAVKTDFREFATASSDSQRIRTSLSNRMEYLGDKATAAGTIDWDAASYSLLARLAYVDIFGSVIGVQQVSPEFRYMGQWQDAIQHLVQPRFLYPDKPGLSDTEVYVRLARANSSEELRTGTSISVGYMAENFVDLGFPGMLAGVFLLGAITAAICRYFMMRPIPWMMREGSVLAVLFSIGHDGVEISLPKLLGGLLMTFAVWVILAKWGFNPVVRWLGRHSDASRPRTI